MTPLDRFRHRARHREPRSWQPALLAPVIFTIGIIVLAVCTPKELAFSRFLAAAPALAASVWSVSGTLCMGLASVATVVVLGVTDRDVEDLFTVSVVAVVTLAAAYASHVRQQRERTLAEVRSVADTAQQVLLRPMPHRLDGVEIETLYLAAAAQARIGGDFYEALDTPHGVRVIIGDVRGKGLPAVGVSAALLGCFREAAYEAADLADLAHRLEVSMSRYSGLLVGGDALERFATVLLAEIPGDGALARIVNCGHPAPLLLHGDGVREVVPSAPSPPINMAALLGDEYRIDTVPFGAGDGLLLYTDGVSETRNGAGVFYPLVERARRWTADAPQVLLERLHEDLLGYSGGDLDDDIAAVVLRAAARPARPARTSTRADPVGP
ncbi:PP2C family protein-serine/threonine phosphatase [Streptomyces sp. NPDC092296]|uniref:PP2C family protein-serine/threonine phosphatase n=1 Tax=Streptomyces sp. NPDC092296 TaxID=3366012 RepID=UPI0038209C47